MKHPRGFLAIPVIFMVLGAIAITIVVSVLVRTAKLPANTNVRACTTEAMQCPDGSYVGRTGPNCEFMTCPVISANTNASSKTYVQITEWGVEIPAAPDASFVYRLYPDDSIASFSTSALAITDGCGADQAPIGVISRYKSPSTEGPLSLQVPIVLGGWNYYFIQPQSTCSETQAAVELQTAGVTALRSSFTGLQSISTDPTAGWKTYTNTTWGFSFKYPSTLAIEQETSSNKKLIFTLQNAENTQRYSLMINPDGIGGVTQYKQFQLKKINETLAITGVDTNTEGSENFSYMAIETTSADWEKLLMSFWDNNQQSSELENMFKEIIATFSFTN